MSAEQSRKAMFAACRKLGMDDADRKAMMLAVTGKASSGQFNPLDWARVLDHLNKRTGYFKSESKDRAQRNEWAWVDRAAEDRKPLLRKLIMLATSAGIQRGCQIDYIEGIAKQSSGLNPDASSRIHKPLRMCDGRELYLMVQMLSVFIRRNT